MTILIILVVFTLIGCEQIKEAIEAPIKIEAPKKDFVECRKGFTKGLNVKTGKAWNKSGPTDDFLIPLFNFIKSTCESHDILYGRNSQQYDIFSYYSGELGINGNSPRKLRCAAMFELLRASGAFESINYNWQEGRDQSASNYTYYTMEAGIFQTSPNSHIYWCPPSGVSGSCKRWEYLDKLVAEHGVGTVKQSDEATNKKWNALMKNESKKDLIFHHHIFMLRHKFTHYGPMIDRKNRVGANLSKACIKEVEAML